MATKKRSANKPVKKTTAKKAAAKRAAAKKKTAASPKKAATPKRAATPKKAMSRAEERFTRDLLVRGEAAYPDAEGKLPSEATHEIVKETKKDGELPEVRRRLFKLF